MLKIIAKLKTLLFSVTASQLIAGMLGAVIMLMVIHFTEEQPKNIATVDISGIVNQFVQAEAKRHLPAKALQENVNQFGQQLQTALNQVAKKHHVVLMVQEAVVTGAPDLTSVVKQQLSQLSSKQK